MAIGDNKPQWPVILFDDHDSCAVVAEESAIYLVREPPYVDEIHHAFDRRLRRVRITANGPFNFHVKVEDDHPDDAGFSSLARNALRLYGPDARWKRNRLVAEDKLDREHWSTSELWTALESHFWVGPK